MSFQDRLEEASFKGVPFYVEAQVAAKGRRVPVRRLAGRDGSRQQDLGREPDQFDVEAFLASEDFDVERNELEDALTEAGPGPLVLPTRGELWVRVIAGPYTGERRTELGFCSVRFTVVLEDKEGSRIPSVSTPSLLSKIAKALKTAATTDFSDTFDVVGMPGKYITSVVNVVQNVTQNLRGIQGKIAGVLNPLDDLTAALAELDAAIESLANTPSQLASDLQSIVDGIFALADTTQDAIDRTTGLSTLADEPFARSLAVRTTSLVAKDLHGLGDDQPASTNTTLGTRNAQNLRAVYRLVRSAAVARQMETYALAPFDASDLALAVLEDNVDEIDAIQALSAGDDLFQTLSDSREALANHLTQTATNLPQTVDYTPGQEQPALLIAHVLYGDARLESDIVARNRTRYPLFVGGHGHSIKVVQP